MRCDSQLGSSQTGHRATNKDVATSDAALAGLRAESVDNGPCIPVRCTVRGATHGPLGLVGSAVSTEGGTVESADVRERPSMHRWERYGSRDIRAVYP